MSWFLNSVRGGVGRLVLFADWLSRPSKIKRSPAEQQAAQAKTKGLSLYQHRLCPFCIKTRRAIHQLNIDIELRDIKTQSEFKDELLREGGRVMVPCLRIEEAGSVRWMYESNDIIGFLRTHFE